MTTRRFTNGAAVTSLTSSTSTTGIPGVTQINLQENFRSSPGIVETARDFITQNADRLPKAMVPTNAQPYEAGDIVALSKDSPQEEARFIASKIRDLVGVAFNEATADRGLSYSDFAILLRSVEEKRRSHRGGTTSRRHTSNHRRYEPAIRHARSRGVDEAVLRRAWRNANLGVKPRALRAAINQLLQVKAQLAGSDQQRWSLYSLQRTFLQFLEGLQVVEQSIPDSTGGNRAAKLSFTTWANSAS